MKSGDYVIHFLETMTILDSKLVVPTSRTVEFGDELTVTPTVVEMSKDRFGHSWLDLLDDEQAQQRKWGKVMFRRGPWPEDLARIRPGMHAWDEAREAAYGEARALGP